MKYSGIIMFDFSLYLWTFIKKIANGALLKAIVTFQRILKLHRYVLMVSLLTLMSIVVLDAGSANAATCQGPTSAIGTNYIVYNLDDDTCAASSGAAQSGNVVNFWLSQNDYFSGNPVYNIDPVPSGARFGISINQPNAPFVACSATGGGQALPLDMNHLPCPNYVHGRQFYAEDEGEGNVVLNWTTSGGDNYTASLDVTVQVVNGEVTSYTVNSFTANLVPNGPSESDGLTSQQNYFTSFIANHQSNNLLSGVNQNIQSRLNGGTVAPQLNVNGFFFQSSVGVPRNNSLGIDTTDVAGVETSSDLNFWVRGTRVNYDGEGNSFDGNLYDIIVGADRLVNSKTVLGVLAGYGEADFDTQTNGLSGRFKAKGRHIGAYVGRRLSDNLTFDGLVAYTRSDYDNVVGVTKGNFDAERFTVAAHLTGSVDLGNFVINPLIGLMYASENQSSYTDSAAVIHTSQTVTSGRFTMGPKITFSAFDSGSAIIQPWVSVKWEYDFNNNDGASNSASQSSNGLNSARVSGGFSAKIENGSSLFMQIEASGLGSNEYTALGGTVGMKVPF